MLKYKDVQSNKRKWIQEWIFVLDVATYRLNLPRNEDQYKNERNVEINLVIMLSTRSLDALNFDHTWCKADFIQSTVQNNEGDGQSVGDNVEDK
jgi:hypothetical protein